MRNPNGYGCIKHLSGRRRRPFVFVVSKDGRLIIKNPHSSAILYRYLQMTNTANEPIDVPLVTNRNLEPLENDGL